jgi:DNA-binding IclR family transcriptional regulator
VNKALQLFKWMVEAPWEGVGVRETAQALRLSASTVHRTLALLQKDGFVQADTSSGRYRLGLEFLRMAHCAVARFPVTAIAMPIMREMADRCKETVLLGLYDPIRQEMIFATSVESPRRVLCVADLNKWSAVYAGAGGLAMMAFLSKEERLEICQRTGLAPITENTITDPTRLEREIQKIRRQGYAIAFGQKTPGAVGLGAPILGANEQVVGSLTITLPEQHFDPSAEPRLAEMVIDGAQRIMAQLASPSRDPAQHPADSLAAKRKRSQRKRPIVALRR